MSCSKYQCVYGGGLIHLFIAVPHPHESIAMLCPFVSLLGPSFILNVQVRYVSLGEAGTVIVMWGFRGCEAGFPRSLWGSSGYLRRGSSRYQ